MGFGAMVGVIGCLAAVVRLGEDLRAVGFLAVV